MTLEVTSLRHVDGDIVEYRVTPDSRAANKLVRDLGLPEGVVVSMIARQQRILPPRGSTQVLPGDYVFLVMRPGVRPLVDRVFGPQGPPEEMEPRIEFPLAAETTVGELEDYYGVRIDSPPETTLGALVEQSIAPRPVSVGSSLALEGVVLHVREVAEGKVVQIGLEILMSEGGSADEPAGLDESPGEPAA